MKNYTTKNMRKLTTKRELAQQSEPVYTKTTKPPVRPRKLSDAIKEKICAAEESEPARTPISNYSEMEKSNKANLRYGRSRKSKQKYLVIVIDMATMREPEVAPLSSVHIVTAGSDEEAERKAVAEDNANNGYGPNEYHGFVAVRVFTRDFLQSLIKEMSGAAETSPHSP